MISETCRSGIERAEQVRERQSAVRFTTLPYGIDGGTDTGLRKVVSVGNHFKVANYVLLLYLSTRHSAWQRSEHRDEQQALRSSISRERPHSVLCLSTGTQRHQPETSYTVYASKLNH